MEGHRLLFVKLLVIIVLGLSSAELCDRATTARVQEGNIGQSGDFNWLGLLSVHLHDGTKMKIALTGIVLITMKHALANADDIVNIPPSVFKTESKAMFFPARDQPWFVRPASYLTHPEYGASTLNSIAIIELNMDEVNDMPLRPICLPNGDRYNTSRYLYLTGYTDENRKVEKVIHKIQYLDKSVCEEFYNRAGLSSEKRVPTAYVCGYAPSNATQCVWDSGMVLVSNATGYFHLIGFGIHGPGCAAPARFIDLFQYFYWINSVISPDEIYDDSGYRRNDDDEEYIPVHELFTTNGSNRRAEHFYQPYPFDTETLTHFIVRPEDDEKNILIFPFMDTWEQFQNACSLPKALMYRERFELTTARNVPGTITYKLTLYDLLNTVASCVRLTVDCEERSDAIISFSEVMDFKEGAQLLGHSGETPEEILQVFGGAKTIKKPKSTGNWVPDTNRFYPNFIKDNNFEKEVLNYDLFITLKFTNRALLKFDLYAEPGPLDANRTWPNISATTATTTKTTTRKKSRLRMKQNKSKSVWGGAWADKMLREDKVKLVADVEKVQETENAAHSEGTPGAVVVACWLISAGLKRVFFVN